MTSTNTATHSSTFTEARAREVMRNVHSDFMNLASAGLITREDAQRWYDDIAYAVLSEVVATFQVQLTRPNGTTFGLSYTIRDDGTVLEDSKAGGFDPFGLPRGTYACPCIFYRLEAPNFERVRADLRKRGWGPGGSLIEGGARDRAFSKDGYGIERSKVGEW
jgi:Bacterial HORMA domain family 1